MSGIALHFARLARSQRGSTLVEFAILAPVIIGMMIATLQIGMVMQSFNAVRNVTADTARYALVEYQKGGKLTNAQIRSHAMTISDGAPYLLNRQALNIAVTDAPAQRVTGVREVNIAVSYTAPSFLPFFDFIAPTVSHSRPMFLSDGVHL